jgi:hypothetical protein
MEEIEHIIRMEGFLHSRYEAQWFYICTTCYKILELCILSKECICVFLMVVTVNINYARSEGFHSDDYEECCLLGCGAV